MPESSNRKFETATACLTWLFRLLVGGTFLFSGFVKAVDPWGTFYKFEEYLAAMGLPMLHTLLVTGVFGLCALEFVIGIFLLFGCYRRSCPIIALIFMCVMLPLTLWIALSNPVNDCGCFGDFIKISNWATFWKNVVLTAMVIWLVKYNKRCITLISPAFQWMAVVISLCFILTISILGYTCQPLLDFRPYNIGTRMVEDNNELADEPHFTFVYEKEGKRVEFNEDDELPNEADGWKFVERKENTSTGTLTGATDDTKTFRIWNRTGDRDITDEVIDEEGKMLMLLIPYLPAVSPATTWKINSMYDWAMSHDTEMIAVVSGSNTEINQWQDMSMPEYDIYTCDDTAIKEVARGNPAVVYLEKGIIKWKSTLGVLDIDNLSQKNKQIEPPAVVTDGTDIMKELFYLYLACLAVPLTLSFLPRIKDAYSLHRRKHETDNKE